MTRVRTVGQRPGHLKEQTLSCDDGSVTCGSRRRQNIHKTMAMEGGCRLWTAMDMVIHSRTHTSTTMTQEQRSESTRFDPLSSYTVHVSDANAGTAAGGCKYA